jgi:predicted nucleic-acid-binding Zn-ribbon protein
MFDTKLSPEDRAKAKAWVEAKKTRPQCPSCGETTFILPDHLVSTPVHSAGGTTLGGTSYVYFMLTCENCGFTYHYNAVIAGLLPRNREGSDD